jgi:hypothetical protein
MMILFFFFVLSTMILLVGIYYVHILHYQLELPVIWVERRGDDDSSSGVGGAAGSVKT